MLESEKIVKKQKMGVKSVNSGASLPGFKSALLNLSEPQFPHL